MTNRLYYAYARHALVTALKMARVKGGDHVLIPNFICRDVLASVTAVDALPLFYDIDEDLQISRSSPLPPAAAILVVNYFGFPANLQHIKQQLSDQKTIIIEDNAHGWLSTDEYGTPLGTRTELGITSFRKTIRTLDGAFLEWASDERLDTNCLHTPLMARDEHLPLGFRVRKVMSRIDRFMPIPLMAFSRSIVRASRRSSGSSSIDQRLEEEWMLPHQRAIHQSSMTEYLKTVGEQERQRRQSAFQACRSLAERFDITFPKIQTHANVAPQGFPYFSGTGDIGSFSSAVTRKKLGECVTWPSLPRATTLSAESPLRQLHLVNFLQ